MRIVSAAMLSTSATICAMAVSEPWPMSTVPQVSVMLPSPPILTMATEVVGAITALKPTASPRPRLSVPLPRVERLLPSRSARRCGRAPARWRHP